MPSGSLAAFQIKLPTFWAKNATVWFAQVEAQFQLHHITSQTTKYLHVVSSLTAELADELEDILAAPAASNQYDLLKAAILARKTPSERRRLQHLLNMEELGDQRPSQLLRRMRQLMGDVTTDADTSLLRELFLQRLPHSMVPILAAAKDMPLDQLANLADRVWKDDAWDARFSLRPLSLVLSGVRGDHEGVYVCRVDFRQAQTINRQVHLVVVVPPSAPVIRDAVGRPLNSSVTVADGDSLTLLCSAHGGRPAAKVTWWRDGGRLEDEPSEAGGTVLRLGPLDRRDLLTTVTCRASNNNISEPVATSVVVDMILGPLSVSIVGGQPTLEAGRPSSLRCVSSGSRPPAMLSWWKGNQRLPATVDGSASTLNITPVTEDDGQQLSCRAVNEQLPQASLEDLVTLRVLYKPRLTLRLGNRLREDSILENHDVYLECNVAANPPVVDITWLFDGHDLQTNTTAGVIVSNRSLVLQKVGRSARGEYQCAASNALGQSRSAALFLRVQFAPICHEPQKWDLLDPPGTNPS
ncbi:hypothetical protein HPB47_026165, partial [Ixodes persulcatus]